MINIDRIQSASFQLVESRYYPSIQLALSLITALGAFYLIKKDSSFFSVKKVFILSGSLSSLSFMGFNFHLKSSIDKGAYGCYQLAQLALARNSSFFYHHYMELCVKLSPGYNQAEKFYQVGKIAFAYRDHLIYDHYMELCLKVSPGDNQAEKFYQVGKIARQYEEQLIYDHYMELCVKVAPGANQAEKFYQVAQIAYKYRHERIYDQYMELSLNERYYQTAQIAFEYDEMEEWFDSITLAADGGHLQARQELTQYYYDTGLLISAKHYSDPIAHPELSTLINKELDKIKNWNTLPLRTIVYTDTYHPSNKVFCYPEQVKNIICFNSPRDTIFNTFQEVKEVICEVQEEGEEFDIFIRENISKLEKLKSFEFKSSGPLCASRYKELIQNLKKSPLLTSLKINTGLSTSSLTTLDLTFFPRLKTLHLNQPSIVSNFDKSSLTDVSLVFDFFNQTSYSEFIQRKNLKNLEFLSLVVEGNSIHILDTSYLENIKILKIRSNSKEALFIRNVNRCSELKTIHSVIKELKSCENLFHLEMRNCAALFSNHDFINQFGEVSGNLNYLDLSGNQLNNMSFIPFSNLREIRNLNLSRNNINTLPDELAQLPSFCRIDLTYNRLTVDILHNFQSVVSRVQSRHTQLGPSLSSDIYDHRSIDSLPLSLQAILDFWDEEIANKKGWFNKAITNITNDLKSENAKQILAKFLNRLTGIKDYHNHITKPNVIERVDRFLTSIAKNKDLQQNALRMIRDNLANCDDRTTKIFDELEILVALHDEKKSLQQKATLVIGLHRYRLLQQKIHEIATKELTGVKDEVELLLYAQLCLENTLGLPVSTKNMLYLSKGKMIDPYIDDIKNHILQQTSSIDDRFLILRKYSSWDKELKKQYSNRFEKISNTIHENLNKPDKENPETLTSEKYQEKCQKLKKLHEEKNDELLHELTREILIQSVSSSSSS
ncbi:MAG: NEL-type E3 ubiquitin ligase domain-containing protein [Rhabdochlamydiaceae bacterium]